MCDWHSQTLSQLCNRLTDGSHFSPEPQTTGRPIVNVKDLRSGYVDFDTCTHIRPRDFAQLVRSGCGIYHQDVLLSKDGTIGKVVVYKQQDEAVALSSIAILSPKTNINSDYLGHYLQSSETSRQISFLKGGSALKRLVLRDIKNMVVKYPSVPEQKAIALILMALDDLIQQTEAKIDKLVKIRAGLMQDLLTKGIDENGQIRDPEKHPEQFENRELGLFPEKWGVTDLASIAVGGITNGYFKKPELVGDGYRLVNVLDLYQDFGVDTNLCERVKADERGFSRYEVEQGDCFFTRSSLVLSGIAQCNIVRDIKEDTLFECHLMRVRPDKSQIVPEFFAHWCRYDLAQKFFMQRARQVTMTTISQPDIEPTPIPLPPTDEQHFIVKILDKQQVNIEAEKTCLSKLKLIKQGLMHDLLTGKVRVQAIMKNLVKEM